MSTTTKSLVSSSSSEDDNDQLRRGPWTVEEDTLLIQYISSNGEGRWNLLAKRSGLRRTGKSCRLRWLNYLKPDVKRGNLSPKEQLMILDLHSKWGNRWSKIAQYLPGRTDNEIKNYWRTRVQKQARQLKIDTNSTQFQNIIRCFWMPRLLQKIEAGESASVSSAMLIENPTNSHPPPAEAASRPQNPGQGGIDMRGAIYNVDVQKQSNTETEYSCILGSEAMEMSKMSQFPECPSASAFEAMVGNDDNSYGLEALNLQGSVAAASSPVVFSGNSGADNCYVAETNWVENDFSCNMWNMDELWPIRY